MKTIADAFEVYKTGLANLYEKKEAEAIALFTIGEITGLSNAKIKAFPEHELTAPRTEALQNALIQLKTGKPVQYVLGKTEFYGLTFEVNPSVLIPRPETEELVQWVIASENIAQAPSENGLQGASVNILDIGTGSGCIAVSLQKYLPDFTVYAVDISQKALKTAENNAFINGVAFKGLQVDILNLTAGSLSNISSLPAKFSIIVSNPPYITEDDKRKMHKNVTGFEPHTALFVPDNDPLIFYKAITDFASKTLIENGLLFFEINENFGKQIVDLLTEKGFNNIEMRKDMSGKDRMVKGSLVH